MSNDHDALFRRTFADPEAAAALLRTALPAPIVQEIDWTTLAPVPATFVDAELAPRGPALLGDVVG